MDLLLSTFKDFFGIVDSKYIIAAVIMTIVSVVAIYIISMVVTSFIKRREAVAVELPDVNVATGNVVEEAEGFSVNEGEAITVELIDPSEDEVEYEIKESNDKAFIEALTIETGELIIEDEGNVDMPEVGEIDYEKIKEKKQKEIIERIRQIAKADEDLNEIEEIMLNNADETKDGEND